MKENKEQEKSKCCGEISVRPIGFSEDVCVRCYNTFHPEEDTKLNYERDYSHTHCWNNEQRNLGGIPPCGQKLEDHKQCCLCDLKYPQQEKNKCEDTSCKQHGGIMTNYSEKCSSLPQQPVEEEVINGCEDCPHKVFTEKPVEEEWEEYSFKGENPEKCEIICDHEIYWCGDSYACNNCGLRFIPAKWANAKISKEKEKAYREGYYYGRDTTAEDLLAELLKCK